MQVNQIKHLHCGMSPLLIGIQIALLMKLMECTLTPFVVHCINYVIKSIK